MNTLFIKTLFPILLLTASFNYSAENSVVPLIEHFESIDNLPVKKFTKSQFNEITTALEKKEEKIRLVSYNMLFNLYDHNLAEENRWPNRLPRIVDLIATMRPDIINTQELYPSQVEDLLSLIDNEFSFFAGQKDADGEAYGILFRTDRFELLTSNIQYPLSMVQLRDLKTDKIVYIYNTHMPLSNIEKREANARAIAKAIEPFAQEHAVIFTGDLNTFATKLDLDKLPFYDGDHIHRILSQGALKNSQSLALLGHFGPLSTFTNNGTDADPFQGTGTPGIVLDYIYVSNKLTVLAHATEPATVDGHFPSDHMPVMIDFIVN